MLSVNGRRSRAGVTWRDYVKGVQNLERCAINFSRWVGILAGRLGGQVLQESRATWGGNEVEWVWLCGVLKRMGRLVVRLKAIKYKEDFSCYLSSLTIRSSLLAVCHLAFPDAAPPGLSIGSAQWVTPSSFTRILMSCSSPMLWIKIRPNNRVELPPRLVPH